MSNTPKENEIKYNRFLNALSALAPDKVFAGYQLSDLVTQTDKSSLPRADLIRLKDEEMQAEAARDAADSATMKMCEMIKNGVVADPEFGDDSALYEALGFIRKSNRRSGLTRKKTDPAKS
jgi:hypothetical protein